MKFYEIIKGLKKNKKFQRNKWKDYFIQQKNDMIFHYQVYDTLLGIRWMPYLEDYEAEDWEEIS